MARAHRRAANSYLQLPMALKSYGGGGVFGIERQRFGPRRQPNATSSIQQPFTNVKGIACVHLLGKPRCRRYLDYPSTPQAIGYFVLSCPESPRASSAAWDFEIDRAARSSCLPHGPISTIPTHRNRASRERGTVAEAARSVLRTNLAETYGPERRPLSFLAELGKAEKPMARATSRHGFEPCRPFGPSNAYLSHPATGPRIAGLT
jgi:hypothetical protein